MTDEEEKHIPAPSKKPIVLLMLDGWGVAESSEANIISNARTPTFDKLAGSFPATVLKTDGQEMGHLFNERPSLESGYYALGTGRPDYNNLFKISESIDNDSFLENKVLNEAVQNAVTNNSKIHLLGLASDANIHSSIDHVQQLLKLAKIKGIDQVFIHIILDGVDTRNDKGAEYIERIENYISKYNIGQIASISGRFYGLDRDNHWERTAKAYNAITKGEGRKALSPLEALKESYEKQIYDKEFFPTVITDKEGRPVATVNNNDSVILFNLRGDRWKQLVKSFTVPGLEKIPNRKFINNLFFVSFFSCGGNIPAKAAFLSSECPNTLTDILQDHKVKRLRLAPSEKYGLITYYFDGKKNANAKDSCEQREVFTSEPGIAEHQISDRIVNSILNEDNDVIIATLTNLDKTASHNSYNDNIKIIENIDSLLQKIYKEILNKNGVLFITSSAGCIESIYNLSTDDFKKEYSYNKVPFIAVGKDWEGKAIKNKEAVGDDLALIKPIYSLIDVSPTILKTLGIKKPSEMKGESIL
jgi:2,3-bisphosphoglycerate-independent phosphoglycerate mutase